MITSFPIDLIKIIRDYLDRKDILNFYLTCKAFNRTNDNESQRKFIEKHISEDVLSSLMELDTFDDEPIEKMKKIYGKFFCVDRECCTLDFEVYFNGIYGGICINNAIVIRFKTSRDYKFGYAYFKSKNGFIIKSYQDTLTIEIQLDNKTKFIKQLDLSSWSNLTDIHRFRTLKEYNIHVKHSLSEMCDSEFREYLNEVFRRIS